MDIVSALTERKIIAIYRGVYGEELSRLAEAAYRGGVRFFEVTFQQEREDCIAATAEAIARLARPGAFIGAGTVLSVAQVDAARDAGASFIVAPNTDPDVIRRAKELGLAAIPGALTPTEILRANALGADFVKLFPSASMGLAYFKDIIAPLRHIRFIMTAGITEENFADYLRLGASGAGISGPFCNAAIGADEIERRARALCAIAEEA